MSLATRVTAGVVCGVAWGAALRGYMAELTGASSSFTWAGTVIGVLLPSAVVGGVLAASTVATRVRTLRWCAVSPLLLALIPLLLPGQLMQLVSTGTGSGAAGVALAGLAGGYAIGGGRRWIRIACGIVALASSAALVAAVPAIGGRDLSWTSPRGVWVMTLGASLLAVLALAASAPFRRLRDRASAAGSLRSRA